MSRPAVSLMTPVYNAMPYLRDYLECVAAQTYRPLELILADDGSSDASVSCIEDYTPRLEEAGVRVKLLKLPHQNQSAAVNAALKEAGGVFLTWCDADDVMEPECVEKKAQFLIDHPEIGMVRNDGDVINGDTGEWMRSSAKEEDRHTQDIFHALMWETTYCYAGCYMVRMDLFDLCYPGREIPVSPAGQNLQLLLPPASRTVCGFIPEVLHHYYKRSSGHSSQKKSFAMYRERYLALSAMFRAVLPHCECDREYYEEEIKKIEKKRMDTIRESLLYWAREEVRKK
ncbi:MAG: glycosyltransferase family 2 protein [Firmicutes bacterium]|nr:glycosyltransferase family 2 protein [Bacillota bacterium]